MSEFEKHLEKFLSMPPEDRAWIGGVYIIDDVHWELVGFDSEYGWEFHSFEIPSRGMFLDKVPDECFSIKFTKIIYGQALYRGYR